MRLEWRYFSGKSSHSIRTSLNIFVSQIICSGSSTRGSERLGPICCFLLSNEWVVRVSYVDYRSVVGSNCGDDGCIERERYSICQVNVAVDYKHRIVTELPSIHDDWIPILEYRYYKNQFPGRSTGCGSMADPSRAESKRWPSERTGNSRNYLTSTSYDTVHLM